MQVNKSNDIVFGKYIDFIKSAKQNPKTEVWDIHAKQYNEHIGQIKWYGHWRKYSFFPLENTIYERTCLMDIVNFLDKLTKEHNLKIKNSQMTLVNTIHGKIERGE